MLSQEPNGSPLQQCAAHVSQCVNLFHLRQALLRTFGLLFAINMLTREATTMANYIEVRGSGKSALRMPDRTGTGTENTRRPPRRPTRNLSCSSTRTMAPHALLNKKAPAVTLKDAAGNDYTIEPGSKGVPLVVFFYPASGMPYSHPRTGMSLTTRGVGTQAHTAARARRASSAMPSPRTTTSSAAACRSSASRATPSQSRRSSSTSTSSDIRSSPTPRATRARRTACPRGSLASRTVRMSSTGEERADSAPS